MAKEITALLTQANTTRSIPPLRQAFNMLKQLFEEAVVLDAGHCGDAPHDLYLFCCEAALNLEDWDIAGYCQDRLLEGTVSTKAYQIRTLFCRAQLESRAARGLRCKELVQGVHSALMKIVRGLKIALGDANQLSHLVLLGTQHIWNTCKPLFKEGSYGELVGTLGFVVYALEKIDCGDWCVRIVWMLRHANALAQSGRSQDANLLMNRAAELAGKLVPAWKYPIFRMQVAISKLVPNPKLKQDAAKGILRGVYAAQALLCGLVEPQAAEADIFGAINELSAEIHSDSKEQPDTAAKGGKGGAPPAPAKGKAPAEQHSPEELQQREECLAELAFAASLIGDSQKAQDTTALALTFKPMKARIYAEYAQAQLLAQRCGGIAIQDELHSNWLTPSMISDLVAAVRIIDRALESAVRVGDQLERNHVVQQGCVLLWNIALPLLQPSLRSQIARSLQQAAKYLDDIGSNMNLLRTLLNLESALTDLDADYLGKAMARVDKALSIDYYVDAEEMALYALPRPLDRYLIWLKRRLGVRSNMYQKPDNPEDEALLVVEQARDSNLLSKLSMLTKATKILQASEPPANYFVEAPKAQAVVEAKSNAKGAPQPKKGAPGPGKAEAEQAVEADKGREQNPELEEHRVHLRNRMQIWHMVLVSSWVEKSPMQLANMRAAAAALLARQWYRKSDRDMRHMQADAQLKLAEGAVVELQSKGLEVAQLNFADGSDSDDDGDGDSALPGGNAKDQAEAEAEAAQQAAAIAQRVALVESAQTELQTAIVSAAKIGMELCQQGFDDQWIVYNACILLWNLHVDAFKRNDFLALSYAIEQLYPILMSVGVDPKKETALLSDVAFTYVRSLLQQYVRDKMPKTALKAHVLSQNLHQFKVVEAGNARLAKAWEVCDKMTATLLTPMDAKNFLMASANIQRLQGKPMDSRTHPQQRVLIAIDQLSHPLSADEKRSIATAAIELVAQDPNVELCARLAERVLTIPNCEKSVLRICAIGQSLYNDGKLGWKQNKMTAAVTDAKVVKKGPAAAAADAASAPLSPRSIPPPRPEDWYWYSLMLQYQGIATEMLVNPQVQDKQTQSEIRRQALVTLTNSALAAGQGPTSRRCELVLKVLRLYRSMCQPFVGDAPSRDFMLPSLRMLASEKVLAGLTLPATKKGAKQTVAATDTDVLADLLLILVTCLKDAGDLQEGLNAMKQALKVLPASHHKPFWSLDIELRCCANIPTNQTLLRIKEYDPEVQAQVWVTLARFAKSEQDQLFALKSAISVLENKPTEQAAHVLLLAQWMLEHNYNITLENFTTLVLGACDLVSSMTDTVEEEEMLSEAGSNSGTMRSRGDSIKGERAAGTMSERRSVTGGSFMKSSVGGKRREKAASKSGDLRAFLTAVQAHYLLAKVNGHGAGAEDGTDTRSSLLLMLHYVMRLWGSNTTAVNQFMQRRYAKALKEEANNAAAIQAAATAGSGATKGSARSGSVVVPQPGTTKDSLVPPTPIAIPSTPQGWISYLVPAEFVETLKQMRHPATVSPSTVGMPEAVVDMLMDAVAMMVREGLELHTHPLLALAALVTDTCLPADAASQSAQFLNSLRRADAVNMASCTALGLLFAVVNPATPALEQVALNEDAKTVQARSSAQAPTEGRVQRPVVPIQGRRNIHKQWIGICEVLLLEGRISSVRDLIAVAHAHAIAYRDDAAVSKCLFIKAKIFSLEGYVAEALTAVQDALAANRCICSHEWVELKLFECAQLVALSRFEAAFASEEAVQQTLASQPATTTNVAKQIAARLVPELQCIFSTRFAATVLRALTANSADVQTQLKNLLAKSVVRAVEQAAACPHLKHMGLLLQVELSAVEAEYLRRSCQFADLKRRLCTDARSLVEAAETIRNCINPLSGSLSTLTTVQRTSQEMQLSRVLCSLGHNVIDRVRMNMKLLQSFRKSSETGVDYPTTSATALQGHVVDFMRSSKKQRDAEIRKKKLNEVRQGIEEKRKEIRAARQAEIDKRRELRRAEEQAQAADVKPGAKNPKGKQAAATAKGAPVVAVVEEPDVSPTDKCGIESPNNSDDDGAGEDSMSDEDEEAKLALKNVEGADEIHLTFGDALDHFNMAIAAACPDTADWALARHGAGRSMLLMYEAMAASVDQRQALVRGEVLPSLESSTLVNSKWNRHIDVSEEVAVDAKTKTGKPAKEDPKKPPAKGAAVVQQQTSVSPVVETQVKATEADILLQQALSTIESCIRKLHADDNLESLASALPDFAKALILKDQYSAAAHALECAQAAKMAQYVMEVWETAAPPQSTEAVILRTLKNIRSLSPHCVRSFQYTEIIRALYQNSRMLSRLRIPELPTAGEQKESSPFSTDTCLLTLTSDQREGLMYAVFRRHTGQVDVRRCEVRLATLEELVQELLKIHSARSALFTTGKVDAEIAEEVSSQGKDVVAKLSVFFAQLLAPFAALFAACTKNHLVLLLDPVLLPLPIEAIPALSKFRSVARDLASHIVSAKLARRSAERFTCTNPNFIVDAFKESPSALSGVFGNDEKPKLPGWQLLTAVLDESKFLRPLNVAVAQRSIANPTSTALVAVASGRLSSTIPLSVLSAMQLDHLRVALLLDRGVNDGAIRRESQVDMKKAPALIWAESPWNVAVILLARGVDCCIVSMAPQLPAVNEAFGRLAITNLDKPGQSRNFAEFFGAVLHEERGTARVGDIELLYGDRISYAAFGICGDDVSGGGAKGK